MDQVLFKNKIKKDKVRYFQLQFTDLMGNEKYVMISIKQIDELLNGGILIDGSDVEGFLRICEDDLVLKPQLTSYKIVGQLSSENWNTARIKCVVYKPDGNPLKNNKKSALSRIIKEAKSIGLEYMTVEELNNFLFKRNVEVRPLVFSGLDPVHKN